MLRVRESSMQYIRPLKIANNKNILMVEGPSKREK